jgi:hypothetical protein
MAELESVVVLTKLRRFEPAEKRFLATPENKRGFPTTVPKRRIALWQ